MEMIGIVLGIIIASIVVSGISGFCGWELLKDKRWFWRIHRDKKVRKIILIALLSTIGIPYVWGFLIIGSIMVVCVDTYEMIRYGRTNDAT